MAMAASRAFTASAVASAKAAEAILADEYFMPEVGRARACGAKDAAESLQKVTRAVRADDEAGDGGRRDRARSPGGDHQIQRRGRATRGRPSSSTGRARPGLRARVPPILVPMTATPTSSRVRRMSSASSTSNAPTSSPMPRFAEPSTCSAPISAPRSTGPHGKSRRRIEANTQRLKPLVARASRPLLLIGKMRPGRLCYEQEASQRPQPVPPRRRGPSAPYCDAAHRRTSSARRGEDDLLTLEQNANTIAILTKGDGSWCVWRESLWRLRRWRGLSGWYVRRRSSRCESRTSGSASDGG